MPEAQARFLADSGPIRGGFTKALDRKRQRRVGLKLSSREIIAKEVEIYERLGATPNVPSVFGCLLAGPPNLSYLCMEEFEGDLSQYVDSHGPMTLGFACAIANHILGALSLAHAKGIIHRDIKPHNVVYSPIDNNKRWKIAAIDWGLAFDTRNGFDSALRFSGTPAFMSVSCLQGNAPHVLDDVESLVYLIQYIVTEDGLPWSDSTDFEGLRGAKEEWVPPYPVLQELLVYARDRSSGRAPDYGHLSRLLETATHGG